MIDCDYSNPTDAHQGQQYRTHREDRRRSDPCKHLPFKGRLDIDHRDLQEKALTTADEVTKLREHQDSKCAEENFRASLSRMLIVVVLRGQTLNPKP